MNSIKYWIASFCASLAFASGVWAQEKPNVVFIFLDNFGWGEPGFNGGGIIRGAPTPAMDALAADACLQAAVRDPRIPFCRCSIC